MIGPGNVRELENVVDQAVGLDRDEVLTLDDLPPTFTYGTRTGDEKHIGACSRIICIPVGTPMARIKNWVILETLRDTGGDKSASARQLGFHAHNLSQARKREGNSKAN